jgi:hypothetical protein
VEKQGRFIRADVVNPLANNRHGGLILLTCDSKTEIRRTTVSIFRYRCAQSTFAALRGIEFLTLHFACERFVVHTSVFKYRS